MRLLSQTGTVARLGFLVDNLVLVVGFDNPAVSGSVVWLPVEYDPDARADEWKAFVGNVDCGRIPQAGRGNPTVGQFGLSRDYESGVQEDSYVIARSDNVLNEEFDDEEELCIAAHAAVASVALDLPNHWGLDIRGSDYLDISNGF